MLFLLYSLCYGLYLILIDSKSNNNKLNGIKGRHNIRVSQIESQTRSTNKPITVFTVFRPQMTQTKTVSKSKIYGLCVMCGSQQMPNKLNI